MQISGCWQGAVREEVGGGRGAWEEFAPWALPSPPPPGACIAPRDSQSSAFGTLELLTGSVSTRLRLKSELVKTPLRKVLATLKGFGYKRREGL